MRRQRVRTTGIVGVCLTLVAAVLAFALDPNRPTGSVSVLATWTGGDLASFRDDVVTPFEKETGITVNVQGSSAESQILAAESETGSPPDVAILSGPGELAGYAAQGRLVPLDSIIDVSDYAGVWNMRVSGATTRPATYWVPVKADLKSLVWDGSLTSEQVGHDAGEPAAWCLGMAAATTSGWPGSDWVEDILLQSGEGGPVLYDELATGRLRWDSPAVKKAFTTWKSVVGAGNAAIARHALTTGFAEAAGTAAKRADCSLEHLPTFARLDDAWKGRSPRYEPSAKVIPGAYRGSDAWEVSGDLAALFRSTPAAERFMRYLTSREAQQTWLAEDGAGFSADSAVPVSAYPDKTARRLAQTLHRRNAEYCWDASDALPPLVRDAFTDAVLRFLAKPSDLAAQLRTIQAASDLVKRQIAGGQRTAAFLPTACAEG